MLDRLSQADRICGIGAVAALISTFLPWYAFDSEQQTIPVRISANAFGSGFLGDVVFFSAVGTVLMLLIRADVISVSRRPRNEPQLMLIAAGVGAAAVVLQMLIGINGSGAFHSMRLGIVVALVSTLAMVAGAQLQGMRRGGRRPAGAR